MAEVVIIGGGLTGQAAAMLLAADGHRVSVLERDPAPPSTSAAEAWDSWERRGVNQFRMLHYFLPRFREVVEAELPAVAAELEADGALRMNPLEGMPVEMSGGLRDDDARFALLTGRRPMVEAAVGRVTARTPGVEIRRGVAVKGLLTGDEQVDGVPHVVGVVTEEGDEVRADLVVDAGGRRSALPRLLADIGARAPVEELEDSGFVYYGRHFRSVDGSLPPAFGPALMPYDSVSILTLPADNGTWGVGLVTSAGDADLRAARDADVWTRVVTSYPLVAHWLDGEPITDIAVMAKIEDRHRAFVVDGVPVATGVVPLGDSWACTNPSVGRGASIGVLHARELRDTLRRVAPSDAFAFATALHDATAEAVEPYFRDTLAFDRHRLAEIGAQIAGVPYETDDPAWGLGQALANAAAKDPELLRGYLEIVSVLARGVDVLSRPGVAERALELGADGEGFPGPTRAELLALVHR
jgi:2-polyprenyl-6-methoxyphenol hydroxylase-like FAD-dependent oxidoreductase